MQFYSIWMLPETLLYALIPGRQIWGSSVYIRMPREAIDAPSLEVLKGRLAGALDSLSWGGAALHMAQGGAGWALRTPPT